MDAKGAIAAAAVFLIAIAVVLPAIQNSVNDSILEICPSVPGVGPSPSPTPTPPIIWNDLSDCGSIEDPGFYRTNTPLLESELDSNCIDILSDNVTLDCNGTVILGTGMGMGIFTIAENVTIYNCTVAYFTGGIYDGGMNGNLTENWLTYNMMGIYLDGATNITVISNNASANYAFGVLVDSGGSHTIQRNECDYNGDGVLLYETGDNLLFQNVVINNTYAGVFFDSAVNNTINQTIALDNYEYGIIFSVASEDNTVENNTATGSGTYDFECIDAFNQTDAGGNTCGTVGGCVDPPGPADWLTSCPPP